MAILHSKEHIRRSLLRKEIQRLIEDGVPPEVAEEIRGGKASRSAIRKYIRMAMVESEEESEVFDEPSNG